MTEPTTLFDKIWADARGRATACIYIDLHLVHEVTSAQAFDGLRLAGRTVRRPDRTLATADHNVPTDGTPVAARIKDELSRVQVETLERNCAEFGVPRLLARLRPPGHRARDRPRARRHAAGHDDRLRRQPHRHARRLRRARLRHRHERGRARARHAVPGPAQAALDAHPLRRRARLRRHRQGPDPRDDRPDGRRRRRRPRRRVRRPGDRGALDGGPHDDLQHDDRGRRPRGHDRARRDDLRVGRRAARRRRRARTSTRWSRAGASCAPTRARRSTPRSTSTSATISPLVTWGTNPGDGRRRRRAPSPSPQTRRRRARARVHGPRGRDADRGDPPRPRLHRLLHELADRRPARRRRGREGPQGRTRTSTRWSCPAPCR